MPGVVAITQASPLARRFTIRLIDRKGDKRAFGFEIPTATAVTDVQINNFLNAYADATNAYLYGVEITNVYGVPPDAGSALNAPYVSLDAIVGVLYKPTAGGLFPDVRLELRAPLGDMVLEGEVVNTADTLYEDVRDTFDALISAGIGTAYQAVSARFTERKDKNSATPA